MQLPPFVVSRGIPRKVARCARCKSREELLRLTTTRLGAFVICDTCCKATPAPSYVADYLEEQLSAHAQEAHDDGGERAGIPAAR